MKKILTSMLLCFFLHTAYATNDTLYIIGQTHVVQGPSFFDSNYQRELIVSQKRVREILLSHNFPLIGDEGLSEKPGTTVCTLKEYGNMPIQERMFRAVPWLLYKRNLLYENIIGIEDPDVHKRMFFTKDRKEYEQLSKKRSEIAVNVMLAKMEEKGVTTGAIVIGSGHIRDVVTSAKKKGVVVYIYCTSKNPEKYL